jgi:signal transduction histidine kinase
VLVLVVLFLLVLRFTGRRRFAAIWLGAWTAHLLGSLQLAVASVTMLSRIALRTPTLMHWLGLLHGPGQYAFLDLLVVGALEAIGWSVSVRRLLALTGLVIAAGFAVALAGYPAWTNSVELVATPILLFGTVQFVLRAARGPRIRGLLCIAAAMIVLGTVASAYLLAGFISSSGGVLATLAADVTRYSGYSDAIATVLLGGAVVVLIVQDTFFDAVQSRSAQVQAVATAERAATLSRVVSEVVRGLGQPINAMLKQSSSLLKAPGTAGATEGLREIRQQAERASHLINDLDAYVRTLGRPEGFVDLSEVARAAASGVASEALRRGVRLVTELPPRIAVVRADRAMIEQVIRGLLDNALAAAGRGGQAHLSVQLHDQSVQAVVEDNGPGVPDEFVPRLFEQGFTTKEGGKESGFGLSLFAQLARSSGGTLQCDNRPTATIGARFVLTLPLAEMYPPQN